MCPGIPRDTKLRLQPEESDYLPGRQRATVRIGLPLPCSERFACQTPFTPFYYPPLRSPLVERHPRQTGTRATSWGGRPCKIYEYTTPSVRAAGRLLGDKGGRELEERGSVRLAPAFFHFPSSISINPITYLETLVVSGSSVRRKRYSAGRLVARSAASFLCSQSLQLRPSPSPL